MTTAVPALEAVLPPQRSGLERLRSELAPTPGRFNATLRIVVATTIVLVTSITLEVPSIALSLFIVLFLTKLTSVVTTQNSVFAAIAGALAIVVVTLAIALTILILRLTIDHPPLRLAAMASVFFLGMFAARVFVLGPAGFLVAIIVLVSQAYVDLFPGPEPIVRAVLWVWVAVVYPAAITVGVNLLLLPADPEPLLRREAADRLRAVARLVRSAHGSETATRAAADLAAWATTGPAPLLKLVRFAEIRESNLRPLHAERTGKILLLQRLVESAALLPDLTHTLSTGERGRLDAAAAACDTLASAVESGARVLPIKLPAPVDVPPDSALTPVLAEIERLVQELPLAERPVDDQPAAERRLFAPDAFTNPRNAQFALKVTLAAMFCYVAYTAVDWDGIHTCMITCAVVALGSAGATIHKSTLRLVGCGIGALLALVAIVFLLPQMESIVPLVLLVAAVTAPAAWIAMGSERTAYLGVQIAFAFYLAVLQGYAPSTDLTELRDRVVGIFFGVIVMAVVFSHVWPERAGASVRRALADALRRMGEAGTGIRASLAETKLQRSRAWRALDEASRAAELYAFEPEAMTAAGAARGRHLRRLIELTRRALLTQAALLEHRAAGATALVAANAARAVLGHDIAVALDSIARTVETGCRPPHLELSRALAAMRANGDAFAGEIALSAILVERIETLLRAAETIPVDCRSAVPSTDRNCGSPALPSDPPSGLVSTKSP